MCGIAGALGRIDERVLVAVRAANERQRHRGPDGDGFISSINAGEGVALAHRRLAIIDLSEGGAQPKIDEKTGASITFNGEIYNYRELRQELIDLGVGFRTESDTEVLLNAYLHWGDEFLSRLIGMFAFAIWDPRQRRMLLARDRLGIKPLYWTRIPSSGGATFLFASELRALLATGLVPRSLDPVALQTYLWHGFVVGPRALARGVERLRPGTALEVRYPDTAVREWSFWSLPAYEPKDGAEAELRESLDDAIRLRLIADVPLGVFLSGGVDSSAVTALAAPHAPGQLRTFNVGFDDAEFDESRFASEVARRMGTDHVEVRLSADSFASRIDDALGSLDQPSFDAINTYFVSRAVREAGITVALAGTGGDELFGGYRSFVDLPRLALGARISAPLGARAARALALGALRLRYGRREVMPQVRWGKLPDALATGGDIVDLYQLGCGLFTPSFLHFLAPELGWSQTHLGVDPEHGTETRASVSGAPLLHAISLLELRSFVGERLLPDTDTTSMAVALEARVPLLDHRVVEAAAKVSLQRRFEPLGRKALLRELSLSKLPADLFDRPKRGFELPMAPWLRGAVASPASAALRARVVDTLSDHDLLARCALDARGASSLWSAFSRSDPGVYWSRPWALFVLLDWCRRERMAL